MVIAPRGAYPNLGADVLGTGVEMHQLVCFGLKNSDAQRLRTLYNTVWVCHRQSGKAGVFVTGGPA